MGNVDQTGLFSPFIFQRDGSSVVTNNPMGSFLSRTVKPVGNMIATKMKFVQQALIEMSKSPALMMKMGLACTAGGSGIGAVVYTLTPEVINDHLSNTTNPSQQPSETLNQTVTFNSSNVFQSPVTKVPEQLSETLNQSVTVNSSVVFQETEVPVKLSEPLNQTVTVNASDGLPSSDMIKIACAIAIFGLIYIGVKRCRSSKAAPQTKPLNSSDDKDARAALLQQIKGMKTQLIPKKTSKNKPPKGKSLKKAPSTPPKKEASKKAPPKSPEQLHQEDIAAAMKKRQKNLPPEDRPEPIQPRKSAPNPVLPGNDPVNPQAPALNGTPPPAPKLPPKSNPKAASIPKQPKNADPKEPKSPPKIIDPNELLVKIAKSQASRHGNASPSPSPSPSPVPNSESAPGDVLVIQPKSPQG